MSLSENNRGKLRRVATYVRERKWEIVLISEVTADQEGVIWLGEARDLIAVVHSKKAAIMLSGEAVQEWTNSGQKKWFTDRTVAVEFGNMRMVAVYQPQSAHNNNLEIMDAYRAEVEQQIGRSTPRETLIIGDDHNAHVGRGDERPGVKGKYGLRRSNEAGEELVSWCEANGLALVCSFYPDKRRGTWFHPRLRQWYEIDGFIMKQTERHKLVMKTRTVHEASFSDHKPKLMRLKTDQRKWRQCGGKKTVPALKHEVLKDPNTARRYMRKDRKRDEKNEGCWPPERRLYQLGYSN